ncbi:MAG: hypothetical protein H6855_07345 [Rhodospirillales bacterium]|nr:hypothetical protein [Rhodospirillales bacterium]
MSESNESSSKRTDDINPLESSSFAKLIDKEQGKDTSGSLSEVSEPLPPDDPSPVTLPSPQQELNMPGPLGDEVRRKTNEEKYFRKKSVVNTLDAESPRTRRTLSPTFERARGRRD